MKVYKSRIKTISNWIIIQVVIITLILREDTHKQNINK